MFKRAAVGIVAASLTCGAAAAQDRATIRLAPRQGAATPMLYTSDAGWTRRDGVDQSLFGVRADTPMPIPAGQRLNLILSFDQYSPGGNWQCDAFFSFEPKPGGAYRVTHSHVFDQSCGAEVLDLATGETAEGFTRVER